MNEKRVAVSTVSEYDTCLISSTIAHQFGLLSIGKEFFDGKKVVIKPNLVIKKPPESAATVHPAVLCGLLDVLSGFGCRPIIAESPGGVYSAARLEGIYRACGVASAAEKYGAELNFDTESVKLACDGRLVKSFDVIKPIAEADVIIDLCKLKSHSLTVMSAAVKNFFGVIPGIEKFEMHATYPDYNDFNEMLCDLCEMLCRDKRVISVTDAVVGMEGNGPTAGKPKRIGYILTSENPFASDLLAGKIIGFDGKVPTVQKAISRGLCPKNADGLEILGDAPLCVEDFAASDANRGGNVGALLFFSQGKTGRIFMPRPVVSAQCRACGECVRSCPQKTIRLDGGRARIDYSGCIRCYCCQELCPFEAIKIKRNPIVSLISKIK